MGAIAQHDHPVRIGHDLVELGRNHQQRQAVVAQFADQADDLGMGADIDAVARDDGFRQAVQVRGVDLMSRCSGVLSGVHTEADIDKSLEAFDGALHAMLTEGLVQHG